MRAASLVAGPALCAALLAACDSDTTEIPFLPETSPTLSASPAVTPTATPTPTPSSGPTVLASPSPAETADMEGFRAFAVQIDIAIAEPDGSFFGNLGQEIEITCQGDEQLGFCMGQPPGTVFRGVPGRAWQSDAFGLFPPDEFAEMLQEWFAAARTDLSDAYGDGAARLFALAHSSSGNADGEYLAIATVIRDTGPATEIQRQARIFRFAYSEGAWLLLGEILAAVSFTANDWLSGECGECYDRWERWEGAP